MLSFDSALSNSLKLSNTTAFWVLKLYYNDESAFIGVSDQDRHDGTDVYYGLVSSIIRLFQFYYLNREYVYSINQYR